jgi:hypothetical protein
MGIKMESRIRIHNTVTGYSSIVGCASYTVHVCQFCVLSNVLRCGEKKLFDLAAEFLHKKSLSSMTEFIRRAYYSYSVFYSKDRPVFMTFSSIVSDDLIIGDFYDCLDARHRRE